MGIKSLFGGISRNLNVKQDDLMVKADSDGLLVNVIWLNKLKSVKRCRLLKWKLFKVSWRFLEAQESDKFCSKLWPGGAWRLWRKEIRYGSSSNRGIWFFTCRLLLLPQMAIRRVTNWCSFRHSASPRVGECSMRTAPQPPRCGADALLLERLVLAAAFAIEERGRRARGKNQ